MLFMRILKYQVTTKWALTLRMYTRAKIGVQGVDIPPMWKNFSAMWRNSNVKLVPNLDISLLFVIKRSKHHSSLEDQKLISYKQEQYACKREPYVVTLKITVPVRTHFLANQSAVHTSQFKEDSLVFKDPELKKLPSSNMEIGTYTTGTVKIVGSCKFYLVHPDTKKLQEVTFFIARSDGSVLLSCTATLAIGFIQSRTRLDYLPPIASTSSVDHPRKTKSQVAVHSSRTDCTVPLQNNVVPKLEVSKLVTSKVQIMCNYPYVFQGIGRFPGPPYDI